MGLREGSSIRRRTLCLHILSGTRIRATVVRLTHAKQHKTHKQMANMEPDNHSMELRQHPNQNTHKTANVEPECQSLDLHQHPNQTNPRWNPNATRWTYISFQAHDNTKQRHRRPERSAHLLPTYLIWYEDQGDVVRDGGTCSLGCRILCIRIFSNQRRIRALVARLTHAKQNINAQTDGKHGA